MHLELPLEQLVRRRGKRAQLSFATEAMQRMLRRNDFVAAPSPLGLRVLAKTGRPSKLPSRRCDEAILEGILGELRASVSAEVTLFSMNPAARKTPADRDTVSRS